MDGKGFHFTENSVGSGDVSVHFSQLTNGGFDDITVGAEMSFHTEEDMRSGKPRHQRDPKGWRQGRGYGGHDFGKGRTRSTPVLSACLHALADPEFGIRTASQKSSKERPGQQKCCSGAP